MRHLSWLVYISVEVWPVLRRPDGHGDVFAAGEGVIRSKCEAATAELREHLSHLEFLQVMITVLDNTAGKEFLQCKTFSLMNSFVSG